MVMTLNNPRAPATKKQLWLLHLLTKTDTRNLDITMAEASKRISELKGNKGNSSKRPMVNPHASYIQQDKQKLAQMRHDKANPQPEREVIQGAMPQGLPDMAMIEADFKANCYQEGIDWANNPEAKIGFYDFQCKECLFGKSGLCTPKWERASSVSCAGKVESVSFECVNHEPVKYSISDYCHRPKGKQCHRKHIDNKCLECSYRKPQFRDGYNHSAWGVYIPTIPDRIKHHSYWLDVFKDKPEALAKVQYMIALIERVSK